MPPLNEPPRSRIHRAYHPAHGGPEPKPLPHPAPRPKADPAPSRWAYRMQRLMLTPLFRQGLRLGLPLAAAFLIGSIYFASDTRREAFNQTLSDMRDAIEQREEFMVKLMQVDGAGEEVAQDIREILPVEFPVSSFHLELDHMRDTIAGLDAVERVDGALLGRPTDAHGHEHGLLPSGGVADGRGEPVGVEPEVGVDERSLARLADDRLERLGRLLPLTVLLEVQGELRLRRPIAGQGGQGALGRLGVVVELGHVHEPIVFL